MLLKKNEIQLIWFQTSFIWGKEEMVVMNKEEVDSRVSLQQRSDGPYITTAVEKENCK